ncbi:DUF3800 domain-containing protein [Lentisalinibacter orientalis]|uniref:DUF3800 domain-containing protein n=1 Tax=Lentisalinibacter orientalis TaxID=2992241 RepID=UPI0038692C0B
MTMTVAYYDEAGDDGYPRYSSPVFVLSVLYLDYRNWQAIYQAIVDFRRSLKEDYGFPVKLEMHSRYFLLNKKPYTRFGFTPATRIEIFSRFCEFIGRQELKIINVAILKPPIINPGYEVLDTALKFSVQRIENDLNPRANAEHRFLVITDEGRVGKMRKTTRRIQQINYIPSKFAATSRRREIVGLIEDPLPKSSAQSHFIQLADVVAQVVYYRALTSKGIASLPKRLRPFVTTTTIDGWLTAIEPSLNKAAAGDDHFGIRYHPA